MNEDPLSANTRPSRLKRLFSWRTLRRLVIALVGLLTLAALVFSIENYRGKRAWESYRQELEAKGESLEWRTLVPAPLPREQNFAAIPSIEALYDYTRDAAGVMQFRDTPARQRAISFSPFGLAHAPPRSSGWRLGERVDLAAWQKYLRDQPAIPRKDAPQTPAEDVMLALTGVKQELAELREASRRPSAQFPIHYQENVSALLPHLNFLRTASQAFQMHALANLEKKQVEEAADDLMVAFRIGNAVAQDPVLISGLVRLAMLEMAMQPLWEGLAGHQWTEAQLAAFEREFARMDLLAEYGRTMRGERNFGLDACDLLRENPRLYAQALGGATVGYQFIPGGWFYQNKRAIARLHQECTLAVVDAPGHRVDPARVEAMNRQMEKELRRASPYTQLARLLQPAFNKAILRYAIGQATVDEARLACALERHRLAKGAYPETLAELSPQYLPGIPADLVTGQPLKYRRTEAGGFTLYSIGWNNKDDNGEPGKDKDDSKNIRWEEGDWVWSQPGMK